jgi:GNAT superfamily N-acetyltransferase
VSRERFEVHPVTSERFRDLEALFGARGACGGCWCMTPRLSRKEYEQKKGEGNRRALKKIVDSGEVPGVLGYLDGKPVAWCSIEPRERFSSLARSRLFQPVDDLPVWSITCLFVEKSLRGKGLSSKLIEGAVQYAKTRGASIVEAYPVEPKKHPMPAVFAYPGLASGYRKVGFREVERRSETRPIVRRFLRGP